MAQAGHVPNLLCAEITGANNNSSTNPTRSISARLFPGSAEYALRLDARAYKEAFDVLTSIAGSAS
jgi:hypothetical protein